MATYEFDIVTRFREDGIQAIFDEIESRITRLQQSGARGAALGTQIGHAVQVPLGEGAVRQLASAGLISGAEIEHYRELLNRQIENALARTIEGAGGASLLTRAGGGLWTPERIGGVAGRDYGPPPASVGPGAGGERDPNHPLQRAFDRMMDSDGPTPAEVVETRTDAALREAITREIMATDQEYLTAMALLATSTNRAVAAQNETLAADEDYLASTVLAAASKNALAAAEARVLAGSDDYLASVATAATSKNELAAAERRQLATNEAYLASVAEDSAAKAELAAAERRELATSQQHLDAMAQDAASKLELATAERRQLVVSQDYLDATAQDAASKLELATAERRQLLVSRDYLDAMVQDTASKSELSAVERQELAQSQTHLDAMAQDAAAKAELSAAERRQLAISGRYLDAATEDAAAKLELAAQERATMAVNSEYLRQATFAAETKAELAAAEQRSMAGNREYLAQTTASAAAKAQLTAAEERALAGNQLYLTQATNEATAKAELAAAERRSLATNQLYLAETTAAATARAQLGAAERRSLAVNDLYLTEATAEASAKAALGAAERRSLATSQLYLQEMTAGAASKAQLSAAERRALAVNQDYLAQATAEAAAKEQLAAAERSALAASTTYIDQTVAAATSREVLATAEREALASDRLYLTAAAQSAVSKTELAAAEREATARNSLYIAATTRNEVAKAELTAMEMNALAGNQRYLAATAQETAAKERLAAAEIEARTQVAAAAMAARRIADEQLRAAVQMQYGAQRGPLEIAGTASGRMSQIISEQEDRLALAKMQGTDARVQAEADVAEAERETAAKQRAENARRAAANDEVVTAEAEYAEAERERAAKVKLLAAGVPLADIATTAEGREGQLRLTQQQQTAQRRLLANMELLNLSTQERADIEQAIAQSANGELELIAQDKVLEARTQAAMNARVRALTEQARASGGFAAAGGGGTGTMFQQIQANLASRTGGMPRQAEEFQTLGQWMQSGLLTTAKFAISGAALFAVINGFREITQYSNQLQVSMASIAAEFNALGQGSQFEGFRQTILSVARDSGVAATEVAHIGQFMKGAFQDTDQAAKATRETIAAMVTTGMNAEEAINSLVAITHTWDVTIQEVSDHALGLQDRFGVAAREIIIGVGNLAPVAQEVGMTMRQTEDLIAAAAQASGRPATAVAEGFGRILPEMQKSAVDIAAMFDAPNLRDKLPQVQDAIALGNYGDVIALVASEWKNLDRSQQEAFVTAAGGRREAQFLISALQNSDAFLREYNNTTTDAGRTQRGFNEIQNTVAQTLARVREQFMQIGDSLARSGLSETIKTLGRDVEILARGLGLLVGLFASVNSATGGWLGRLVELGILIKGLQFGMNAIGLGNLVTGGTGGGGLLAKLGIGGGSAAAGGQMTLPGMAAGGGAALSISPWAAPITAAVITGVAYQGQREGVQGAEADLRERMKTMSDARIAQLARDNEDFWTKAQMWLFGADTPGQIAREIQRQRAGTKVADTMDAAVQGDLFRLSDSERQQLADQFANREGAAQDMANKIAGRTKGADAGLGPNRIKYIQDQARKGNQEYIDLVNALLDIYNERPGGGAAMQAALAKKESERTDAENDQLTSEGQTLQSAQAALAAYQSGNLTLAELLRITDRKISAYRGLADRAGLNEQQQQQMEALIKQRNKALSDSLRSQSDLTYDLNNTGGVGGAQADVNRLTQLLQNPQFTDLADRTKAAHDLVAAQKALTQARVQGTKNVSEQIRILREGTALTREQRTQFVVESVGNSPELTGMFDQMVQVTASLGRFRDQFVNEVGTAIAMGKSGSQAIRAAIGSIYNSLREQYDKLQAQFASDPTPAVAKGMETLSNELLTAGQIFQQIDPVGYASAMVDYWQKTVDDLLNTASTPDQIISLQNAIGALQAAKDALAKAKAAAQAGAKTPGQDAQDAAGNTAGNVPTTTGTDPEEAARKQRDLDDAIARANLELEKAKAGNDPAKLAAIAQREADLNAAIARRDGDKAAEIQAQIARIQADEDARMAPLKLMRAATDLSIAMANAASDQIAAAKAELDYANANLTKVQTDPLSSPEDLLAAQTEQINRQEALRHTTLAQREADIEFNLQMDRISKQQALAMYEGLLANADLLGKNEQDKRDLLLKIHQLRKDLDASTSMGIPSDIKVPTLYEVRRYRETGGGYQDNRTISVQMDINNGMDQAAAANFLSGVFRQANIAAPTATVRRA